MNGSKIPEKMSALLDLPARDVEHTQTAGEPENPFIWIEEAQMGAKHQ